MGNLAWGQGLQAAGQGLSQWAQFQQQKSDRDAAERQRNNELGLRQLEMDRQAMLDALSQERADVNQGLAVGTAMSRDFGGQLVAPGAQDLMNRFPVSKLFTEQTDPMAGMGALDVIPSQREGAAVAGERWMMPESEKLRIAQVNAMARQGVANTQAQSRERIAQTAAEAAWKRLGVTDATRRMAILEQARAAAARINLGYDALENDYNMGVYRGGVSMFNDQNGANQVDMLTMMLMQGQVGQPGAVAPPAAGPQPVAPQAPPPPPRGPQARSGPRPQGGPGNFLGLTPPPGIK
jgi:hypothetical protein